MEVCRLEFNPALLGEKIGVGATAAIFAYGTDKVIKIFHKGKPEQEAIHEWSQGKKVEQTLLPVPKNYGVCRVHDTKNNETDGCYAVLQERIFGQSLMKQIMTMPDMQQIIPLVEEFVELQVKMHKVDATKLGLREQKATLRYYIQIAPLLTEQEKEQLYDLLERLPEGNKLCHGDYHFDNVFITDRGFVIFDWCDANCGNPAADLARSLLIFKCEAMPDSIPKEVVELIKLFQSTMNELYPKFYFEHGGVCENLEEWMAIVAAARLFCEVKDNQPAMLKIVRNYLQGIQK